MTPYIKNQLIKLCDHPEWFNDMLTIWDNNPEEPHTAIRNYLSHVQLNDYTLYLSDPPSPV